MVRLSIPEGLGLHRDTWAGRQPTWALWGQCLAPHHQVTASDRFLCSLEEAEDFGESQPTISRVEASLLRPPTCPVASLTAPALEPSGPAQTCWPGLAAAPPWAVNGLSTHATLCLLARPLSPSPGREGCLGREQPEGHAGWGVACRISLSRGEPQRQRGAPAFSESCRFHPWTNLGSLGARAATWRTRCSGVTTRGVSAAGSSSEGSELEAEGRAPPSLLHRRRDGLSRARTAGPSPWAALWVRVGEGGREASGAHAHPSPAPRAQPAVRASPGPQPPSRAPGAADGRPSSRPGPKFRPGGRRVRAGLQ